MTVIVCIDERGGMTFLKRRLSRDKILIEDIAKTVGDAILYISDFSEALFIDSEISVMSVSNPLLSSQKEDFAFIEDIPLSASVDRIETLIIYKWNRKYPFDFALDIDPLKEGFSLVSSCDFKGSSHDKITKEIYRK